MCFERRYVIEGLEAEPILRTAEQVWVVKMFADGNKWEVKPEKVVPVLEICGRSIQIGSPKRINLVTVDYTSGSVNGYVLFDASEGSLPSHKLSFNKPGLSVARWYVNSVPKTVELIRHLDWWNGNPPVKAILGMWSNVTGVKILGKPISVGALKERLGE